MDSNRLMYGSVGAGILAGVLLLGLLGWMGLVGWVVAGFAAGLASRGSGRGFLSGLVAGIIVSAVAIAVALFVPMSTVNSLVSYVSNPYLTQTVVLPVYQVFNLSTYELLKKIAVDLIAMPAIGGFIGGAIASNGYLVREEEEPEQVKAEHTGRLLDEDESEEVS